MPLMRCMRGSALGYKWGRNGRCYIGKGAKDKALKQGRAIEASKRNDVSAEIQVMRRLAAERLRNENKKLRKVPRWLHPIPVENRYRRELVSRVNEMQEAVNQIVVPALPGLVDQVDSQRRSDGWPDDVDRLVESAQLSFSSTARNQEDIANEIGGLTDQFNYNQWKKTVRVVMGVNITASEPWLNDQLTSFTKENVSLITSLDNDTFSSVEGIVQRGLKGGERHERIARNIQRQFRTSRNRAKLIGRDQVSKLNGQLTGLRQQSIGITHYIWRTSDDDRVRPTHREKDDRRFAWDSPPADTGHPGQDYQCRCWAEADFSTVEGLENL